MQLHAGYTLQCVHDHFKAYSEDIKRLVRSLSYYELETNFRNSVKSDFPEIATLDRLVSRGLPTRPSLFVEEALLKACAEQTLSVDELGNIEISGPDLETYGDLLERAVHLVDPRIDKSNFSPGGNFSFDSHAERTFFMRQIPSILGAEFLQLIQTQRKFTSIVNGNNRFRDQRADFALEFPFWINGKRGIIIEVDGPQHQEQAQFFLDDERDEAVVDAQWVDTIRIPTEHLGESSHYLKPLKSLQGHEYFQTIKTNFNEPLYRNKSGLEALHLTLSPLAIARIQKTFLRFLLHDQLSLEAPVWNILVFERDVTCAALAIEDLMRQIFNIYRLRGKIFEKRIDLTVIQADEFRDGPQIKNESFAFVKKVRTFAHSQIKHIETTEFDLLLDVSMLQREGLSQPPPLQAKNIGIIRSVHYTHAKRLFETSGVISYAPILIKDKTNGSPPAPDSAILESLEYFLHNIFRKNKFRSGQLEILNKALQGDTVIGLLPTGGGKSLTYQLAALLQPGVCLVIDPIKSLMKDQCDNLRKSLIDACTTINSSLKTREDKTRETNKLRRGEVLFCFVSPERLQMKEFRDILSQMYENEVYFNYCVIDEAHCVSEWGHDFRTSYLSLGKNAIEYCRTKNKEAIPLFGLTATASFDVLSDIQRELSGNDDNYRLKEDSVVRFDSVNRTELTYSILDVKADLSDKDDEWALKEKLGKKKQSTLVQELRKYRFDEDKKHAGIVFCPHRGWYFGVTDKYKPHVREGRGVYDIVRREKIPLIAPGSFMGSDSDNEDIQLAIEKDSFEAQEKFINNELNLLVSTKAFGMGIDKPNVRFTFHMNYPSSIESFVQEAGRAGRDRKDSKCYILFNDEQVQKGPTTFEIDRDNLLFFHNASFKGVEKENAIIHELLTAIYTPNQLFDIEVKCFDEFKEEVNLALWQSQAGYWYMFVNGATRTDKYGALQIPSLQASFRDITMPANQCEQVLTFIKQYINTHLTGEILPWLNKSKQTAGIETLLEKHQQVDLTIRFDNNTSERIEIISKWLKAAVDAHAFDLVTTRGLLIESNSFEDFKSKVSGKINTGLQFEQIAANRDSAMGNQSGTSERELKKLFLGFRIKSDTEKALYRLSTIGVIDDYTVDFNTKTYTIHSKSKDPESYYKSLEGYIRKYYSEVRTRAEIEKARRFEGRTAIQKCSYFLTSFVYREIQKKRFEGIGAMKEACIIGRENGNGAFKEFVDLYFNSKYARKGYEVNSENKSITDRTDEGKEQSFSAVWEFIEVTSQDPTGSQIDNIKHLRGACVRLLIPQPNNGTLHLLKAFSLFILEPNNQLLVDEASESFSRGFIELMRSENLMLDLVIENAERFKNYILQFSTHGGIQQIMDNEINILSVKIHLNWLTNFNNKFLEGYE